MVCTECGSKCSTCGSDVRDSPEYQRLFDSQCDALRALGKDERAAHYLLQNKRELESRLSVMADELDRVERLLPFDQLGDMKWRSGINDKTLAWQKGIARSKPTNLLEVWG